MSNLRETLTAADSSEVVSNLFEPDFILPSQLLEPDEKGLTGGERRLMAALLSDGIEAYIAQSTTGLKNPAPMVSNPQLVTRVKVRGDAQEWVETVDETYVFSFDNVCESLGIDPHYLRLGLSRYVEAVETHRSEGGAGQSPTWKKIRRPRKQ